MQLDNRLENKDMLLRELIYGPAKAKKTWWIGKAAEAGYNILLLEGDRNWHILNKIKPEAQKRIQIVDMSDERGRPIFAMALARLLKDGKIIWDEKEKKSSKLKPNENCISVDLDKLGRFDIVALDSWTALVRSLLLQYAKEQMIDLSQAEEGDDKWGYYRWAGALASWMLSQLSGIQCHKIVTAHVDMYEKRSKDGKKIEWSKRQVKSTSGPHAMQLPSQFSDILYFYPKGSAYKIDTSGSDEADGGSCLVKPGIYNWDDLQFVNLIKAAGLALPPEDHPLIDYSIGSVKPAGKDKVKGVIKPGEKPGIKLNTGGKKLSFGR